jgi:hypothetical protein
MKLFFGLAVIFMITVSPAKAQWTETLSNLYPTNYNTAKIGIGTNLPTSPLHIISTVNKTLALDFTAAIPTGEFTWQSLSANNTEQWRIVGASSINTSLKLWNPTSGMVMTFLQNGNVGIGTTAPPPYKLTVNGPVFLQTVDGGALRFQRDHGSYLTDQTVITANIFNIGKQWNSNYSTSNSNETSAIKFGYRADVHGLIRDAAIRFFTQDEGSGNTQERMSIVADKVGIGTTNPDEKLTVKGKIHTQEVRVDLAGAITPDYVFEKDYNLLPLSELETYINANKHLPEVPSAKQMEAEGLNLKEMNLILLKKVEELTLHLISKEKEIEELQERMDKIELRGK